MPHDIEIEAAVIGALLSETSAIVEVGEILKPETFYSPKHQIVYAAIQRLFEKGVGIDMLTVTNELRVNDELESVGGAYEITDLTSRVGSTAHLTDWVWLLTEKHLLREMIRINTDGVKKAFDQENVLDLQEKVVGALIHLGADYIPKQAQSTNRIGKNISEKLEQIKEDKKHGKVTRLIEGVTTGFAEMDEQIGGIMKPELVYLAARPGEGKTALMLNMALRQAKKGIPVGIFSLEMKSDALFMRMACIESQVGFQVWKTGSATEEEIDKYLKAAERVRELPIFIDDDKDVGHVQVGMKAKRMKLKYGIQMFYLDYIQKMTGKGRNRDERIEENSKGLTRIAADVDAPFMALSQIKRDNTSKKKEGRYQPDDLAQSGSLEQDADMIWFCYRPVEHGEKEDSMGLSTEKIAYIDVAKSRNGVKASVKMKFEGAIMRFSRWTEDGKDPKYDADVDVPF
jgi:replicative DNA helicase